MDSELLEQLANHPRIVGIKHSDHDLGKIARLTNRSFDGEFVFLSVNISYSLHQPQVVFQCSEA
jgi:dihydrodipicolinate synthase/N-acetylneuraminate lyase